MAADGPNCGYCMLEFKNMVDPRRLPCGHIFCLGCLQGDFSAGGVNTKCNQCGELHSGLALNELPTAKEGEENSDTGEGKLPPIACSKNCENKAISFCEDCSVKMCEEHKKAHDNFLTDHKYVPFLEYRKFPEKYDRPMCNTHNKKLSLACETCDVVVCEECDLTSPCNQGGQHKFRSLAKSMKQFASDYSKLIASVSEQHSTFTKKQKETEAIFEELVVNYNLEEKLAAVDSVAEQQIAEIRRRAEVKKKEIREFPVKMDTEVTAYSEGLVKKEQQLDDLEKTLSKNLRELHIVENIRRNKGYRKSISSTQALETGNCGILRKMVVAPMGFSDIGVQFRPLLPSKLVKFFNGSSSNRKAQRVMFTDPGDILLCYNNQVELLDAHCKKTKFSVALSNVVSVWQHHEFIYVATSVSSYLECQRFYIDSPSQKGTQIFRFATDVWYSGQPMVIRKGEIIAIDNSSYHYQLRVYDLSGKHLRNVSVPRQSYEICSLPDGFVLLRDEQNYVRKYDISSSSAVEVWNSTTTASSISTDSVGLCYGTNYRYRDNQSISLYWPASKSGTAEIKELQTEEYNTSIPYIAVNKNVLAVIGQNSFVQLYYIEF
ncbi:uncharacterized protein [Watersipora subatra]|uniref:uncharacterized protein n=1 Tax=Watersipora subatra TaxID=2589382 RepID=UPI00355BF140